MKMLTGGFTSLAESQCFMPTPQDRAHHGAGLFFYILFKVLF